MSTTSPLKAFLPAAVFSIFDLVELAESAIDRAMKRSSVNTGDPALVERLFGSFRMLAPQPGMSDMPEDLYRRHCDELLRRVEAGAGAKDLNAPSDAEIAWTLRNISLVAPLRSDAALVYERVVRRLLPGALERAGVPSEFFRETFAGAADLAYDDIVSHLARRIQRDPVEPRRPPQARLDRLRITLPDPLPEQVPLF